MTTQDSRPDRPDGPLPQDVVVRDDAAGSRYVLTVRDEEAGTATYHRDGDLVVIEHTVVDTDRREKGLGGLLARAALDDIRARGLRVVPQCPFIAAYIERNPEYADLVAGASDGGGSAP